MSESFSFGDLKKKSKPLRGILKGKLDTTDFDESKKPRNDYKKLYEEAQKTIAGLTKEVEKIMKSWTERDVNLKAVQNSIKDKEARIKELEGPIADEMDMLRQQEGMQKRAIDRLTKEVEQYKFRPQQYSKIINILNCLQINTNKRQRERLIELIGVGNSIYAVRDAIIELLEAPYQ